MLRIDDLAGVWLVCGLGCLKCGEVFLKPPIIYCFPKHQSDCPAHFVEQCQPVHQYVDHSDADEDPAHEEASVGIAEVGEGKEEVGAGEQGELVKELHVVEERLLQGMYGGEEEQHHQAASELGEELRDGAVAEEHDVG